MTIVARQFRRPSVSSRGTKLMASVSAIIAVLVAARP
jgi:hypothetical protein